MITILSAGSGGTGQQGDVVSTSTGFSGGGTSTAGIMAGGGEPNHDYTETYDGTSWTEVADLNTARMAAAMAGSKSLASKTDTGDPARYSCPSGLQ